MQVDRELPCKHTVGVECSLRYQNPPPVCTQQVNDVFTYECGIHSVKPMICSKYTALQLEMPKCKIMVPCTRYRCGHNTVVACYLKKLAENQCSHGKKIASALAGSIGNLKYFMMIRQKS